MSATYQATFRWPRTDASNVIVTGSFDSWSGSHHLTKTSTGFEATVEIPWGEKVSYKYIVDGRWTTTDDQPTELDPMGNLNNVFCAPARPVEPEPTPAPEPAPAPETEPEAKTVGTLNGFVETAKQAAVSMVEALAPGTTVTPAETPATEVAPEPSPEPPVAAEPESAPAPSEPQPVQEITVAAVLPSEPAPVAPEVPVPILPLSTEPPSDAISAPVADVSETKPLDTTIVEGTATAAAPAAETSPAEDKPSTHTPASPVVNGISADKPATNGVAANGASAPESPKPTPSRNGSTDKAATVNGKVTTPSKEKKMRFPSFSSRHSRARSSVESGVNELGEKEEGKEASTNGKGNESSPNGKETVSSRFASTQRQKRRTSLFGKLKDAFHSPKKEASA